MTPTVLRHIVLSVATILLVLTTTGCELASSEDSPSSTGSVLVANQGNFGDGNGSITAYDAETMKTRTMASNLASIVQSILVADERVLVASNTGNRIDVFAASGGNQIAQITGVSSPRYMGRVSASTIVVTNLFDNTLSFIDLDSSSVTTTVAVGANPEGVLVRAGEAYVSNHGFGSGSTVSVVDLSRRIVSRTITVNCDGPRFTAFDRQGELLVVCSGQTIYDSEFNVIGTTDGAVLVLDAATGNEKGRIIVDGMILTAGPGQDAFYSSSAALLFIVRDQSHILVIDTDLDILLREIGPLSGAPIGGVAYSDSDGLLYVARVPGFTQSGSVTIMTTDGSVVGQFQAGVAPSHIDFFDESQ